MITSDGTSIATHESLDMENEVVINNRLHYYY